ncbi:MAG: competence/damage-inducible protein A [Myxococcales bacterium]|nr:competence/damage-inducible protein A [Myxococcales bacterium]MCB9627524.1 competence/damage-inducible protein A [Sandaracinaceae bacterium]
MPKTAAALMVGNEILTGKIEDTNTRYLARVLFELGVALRQVVICPDETDIIVRELNALRAAHDMVFTSGGVGPTHDDITIDAVAAAFGRPVVESPEIAAMIRSHFGDIVTPAHLRMANMPEGSELVRSARSGWPTVVCENVYILPGVPEIFERKLDALRERLDEGQRFFNHTVYTHCDEGEIAELLTTLTFAHPAVTIGSYLVLSDPTYRVRVTFDSVDALASQVAADAFTAALPVEKLARRT